MESETCEICDGSGVLQIVSCKEFFELDWDEAKYIAGCHACENGRMWRDLLER